MDLSQLRNFSIELQFQMRKEIFSKLRFRSGLPKIPCFEQLNSQNSFYEHILSLTFKDKERHSIDHVVDIGCSNWSYSQILSHHFPNAKLTGIEVDGGRRYWNLYKRIDMARAFANNLVSKGKAAQVIEGDFQEIDLHLSSENVLFCFFFPFVSNDPCHSWGLPQRFANFRALLLHSRKLSERFCAHAQWLSVHQGEWEGVLAQQIYQSLNLDTQLTLFPAKLCPTSWRRPYDTWIFRTS